MLCQVPPKFVGKLFGGVFEIGLAGVVFVVALFFASPGIENAHVGQLMRAIECLKQNKNETNSIMKLFLALNVLIII